MATSGASAAAAAAAHEEDLSWRMFKHQIRLTVGLLRNQTLLNDQHHSDNKNILLCPHPLVSSLATLVPGKETDIRVQLVRSLLHHKINGKFSANDFVGMHCSNNRSTLKKNKHSLQVDTFQYRDPSCPIKSSHVKKLWKKYRSTGKELSLMNGEKPCLETLQTINRDFHQSGDSTAMLSTADYVSLVNTSIDTILVNSVHFKSLWSKPFEVQYGEFRKPNGQLVKTELLYKKKSFLYHEDHQSMAKGIKVNFSHDGSVSMVLIMPQENISLHHFVNNLLDYDALKRILKNINTRYEVKLTLPRFKITAHNQVAKPLQYLRAILQLDQEDMNEKNKKKQAKQREAIRSMDEKVIVVQRMAIEIDHNGENDKPGLKSQLFSHKEVEFNADRPFLFLLVNNGVHKQILFVGVCNDPTQTST